MPRFADESWSIGPLPRPVLMALATFGILALELALIRWSASQVRILAYFNNLVLIGAFLGMGLGVALGKRRPGLVHATLPAAAALAAVFALSGPLGLMHLAFPDPSVWLWSQEGAMAAWRFVLGLAVVLVLFWSVVAIFLFAGSAVEYLFTRVRTLKACTFDLGGSLLGVLAVAGLTALQTGPHWWFLLGCAPFVLLSRRWPALLGAVIVIGLAWITVGDAQFSPYNRIDLEQVQVGDRVDTSLSVNRDFHQTMHDLSDEALANPALSHQERLDRQHLRRVYDLPYRVGAGRHRALIVGAGTGNDAQAALRGGFAEITSVDIDGRIIALGREHHPEHPYDDDAVRPVINDARAFFEQYAGRRSTWSATACWTPTRCSRRCRRCASRTACTPSRGCARPGSSWPRAAI